MSRYVKDIGEFGLIDKIAHWVEDGAKVVCGVGDDAAVLRYIGTTHQLFATDVLIEGVHFKTAQATPYLIGRKALAVNISDIAAMGGVPRYATVTLAVPKRSTVAYVQKLYRGITNLASRYGIGVVGGDTTRSDKLMLNVSMLGEVKKKNLV
jgi:thiamine-monophosphate kinase